MLPPSEDSRGRGGGGLDLAASLNRLERQGVQGEGLGMSGTIATSPQLLGGTHFTLHTLSSPSRVYSASIFSARGLCLC